MDCPHGLPLQVVKEFGCDDCVNDEQGGVMDELECGHSRKTICQDCFDNVVAQLESQRDVEAKEVDRLRASLAAKEEALRRYGKHLHFACEHDMASSNPPACRCGLAQVLWPTPTPAHDWKTCSCLECNQRKIDEDYYGPAREYRADADRGGEERG